MSDISFEEVKYKVKPHFDVVGSKMIDFLINKHIVKSENQAYIAMFALVFILIGSSVYMLDKAFGNKINTLVGAQIIPGEQVLVMPESNK
jgi:hypothetical protein